MKNKNYLTEIARKVMIEKDLLPDFSPEALEQTKRAVEPALTSNFADGSSVRDLSNLLWCSIDNDDSRDLDQLTASERLSGGQIKIWIAIADVDALVFQGTPVDEHAEKNTTSVYTSAQIFPMLPEKFSTDLTSLVQDQKRLSVVTEIVLKLDGELVQGGVYRAIVCNKAKLAYNSVAAFLEGRGPLPAVAAKVPGMDEQLRTQDEMAQKLRKRRLSNGALELETIQATAIIHDDQIVDFESDIPNRAKQLIEDLMIAANGVTARFLVEKKFPALRRIVRTPKRWSRIVEVASQHQDKLPAEPDSKALSDFLVRQKQKDPLRFPDLSLSVIKLLGRGEYVLQRPGESAVGHFGLAVKDYIHSTAPNRRFPDLITQRLLKAAIGTKSVPYPIEKLNGLAQHCTEQEDNAEKVERQVQKSAAALFLSHRIGETFKGIVTGNSDKGVWVRLFKPSIEGKIVKGQKNLDVGDRVQLRLIEVNVKMGWIDFEASKI